MPLDCRLRSELVQLEEYGRRVVRQASGFQSDALLLLADAAEELAQAMRLDGKPEAAAEVVRIAGQFRSLAPMVKAP